MQLDKSLRKRLAGEFDFAAQQMAQSKDLMTKLYFYSAFYAEVERVLNQQWDANLSLLHLVLTSSHATMMARMNMIIAGADRVIGIPNEFPDALTKTAAELASLFQGEDVDVDEDKLFMILARLAELAYITQGNGHYLYLKGKIKL
jgi:hypothetical protein